MDGMTMTAVVGLLVLVATAVGFVVLFRLDTRRRRLHGKVTHDQRAAAEMLERAGRLADVDRILTEDPAGTSIDPEREPALRRIFLLRSGRITLPEFISQADREAVLDRLAVDLRELEVFYQQDETGLRTAWRRHFGRDLAPDDIERMIGSIQGERVV